MGPEWHQITKNEFFGHIGRKFKIAWIPWHLLIIMDGYTKYYMSFGSLPCGGQGGPIGDPQMAEMAKFEEFLILAKNQLRN